MSHKILVVDDSEIARRELIGPLEEAGFVTTEADSGQEALKSIEQHRDICLIITDIHMPIMNGIEMCEELSTRDDITPKPPILVVSTESTAEMKDRGKKAGVSGWVIKPVDTTKLVKVAKMLIEKFSQK